MDEQLTALAQQWATAERQGDTAALDTLLSDNFVGIGPAGYVLNKTQWLDRFVSGQFSYSELTWQDLQIRLSRDTAIVFGTQVQRATYQERPSNGQFRGMQVYVQEGSGWRLLAMQLSPLAPRDSQQ